MQFVVRPQLKSFNPGLQIIATAELPAQQIVITDAAVVGINQVEAAVAAAEAGKGIIHSSHIGTESLNAKVKNELV